MPVRPFDNQPVIRHGARLHDQRAVLRRIPRPVRAANAATPVRRRAAVAAAQVAAAQTNRVSQLIEICELRQSVALWSKDVAGRLRALQHLDDRLRRMWLTSSGRDAWLYLTEVLVDLRLHKQKPEIAAGFKKKVLVLLAFHLVSVMAVVLAVASRLPNPLSGAPPGGPLVGVFLSFLPWVSLKAMESSAGCGHFKTMTLLLVHTLVHGIVWGVVDPGPPDGFQIHVLLISTGFVCLAASLTWLDVEENMPLLPPTKLVVASLVMAVFCDLGGILLVVQLLNLAVNWRAALCACFYVSALVAFFCWRHGAIFARSNPDEYMKMIFHASRYLLPAASLRLTFLLLKPALCAKLVYNLLLILLGAICVCWLPFSDLDDDGPASCGPPVGEPSTDLRCVVRSLPFGIELKAHRLCLPRVTKVAPGSAAELAGVRVGDVLVGVAGRPVTFLTWATSIRAFATPYELRFRRARAPHSQSDVAQLAAAAAAAAAASADRRSGSTLRREVTLRMAALGGA